MGEKNNSGRVIYLSHGGGPLPILGDPTHDKMNEFMAALPQKFSRPDAIVVFSAHWEENIVTIQSGEKMDLVYDYYGFPDAAYNIEYPVPGNKSLARQIGELFDSKDIAHRIEYRMDDKRPYDHGSYIPLKMMYPDADIPVLQISLHSSLDPEYHLRIGEALKPLLAQNILFLGSGFSFHNMAAFDFTGANLPDEINNEFQDTLIKVCATDLSFADRWEAFLNWESFPGARYAHPREEHLLPLLVCAGLAPGSARTIFDDYIAGKRAVAFRW